MRFSLRHAFDAPVEAVERAMFDPALPAFLKERMAKLRDIEVIERREDEREIRRRVRYVPSPLIERIGPKQVDPRWMTWVEESVYDRAARRMTFRNLPASARVAELLDNHGTLSLRAAGDGAERVIEGELRVKVLLLGRVAERIIHAQAAALLDEEAAALASFLRERRAA